ncbi:MAG: transglutaminase-like domain-containing protein [Planctomycetota bacterium]
MVTQQITRRLTGPLLSLIATFLFVGPAFAQELWYTATLAGQPAGWMRSETTEAGGLITVVSETELSVRRGPLEITIRMESESVETVDGEPVRMRSVQKLATAETVTEYTFGEDEIDVTASVAGQTSESTAPLPEPGWLMPAAAGRAIEAAIRAGDDLIEIRVMDPSAGATPIGVRYSDPKPAPLVVGNERIEGTEWTVQSDLMPGIRTAEVVDADGDTLRSTVRIGAIEMVMTRASADEVAAIRGVPTGDMPELMLSTFVAPSRKIDEPRRVSRGEYVLRFADGEVPELPAGGLQSQTAVPDGSIRVVVSADPADAAPGEREPADLADSSMIKHTDPRVRELHERAVRGLGTDQRERAEAMRRFVHRTISAKNLSTALGSASEVARSRSGDCTEHAVLLAALLRADGIPSRAVSGVIYADAFAGARDIFGYHMWTRALLPVDGVLRWIDLDATLGPSTPFDATHIALAETAFEEGAGTRAFSTVALFLGRLEIEVVETEHDGR